MELSGTDEIERQRAYYAETARRYNEMHVHGGDNEHNFSLAFMVSTLDYLGVKSVLDIGSGTGRTLIYLREKRPDIRVVGIEPVKELREIGYKNGISETALVEGDALNLEYKTGEFDLVCEYGMLHHVRRPETVVSEMLRVAKKAIFLSDSNNFGQGSATARNVKQIINLFGLWRVADFIKTKGKGYSISEGDGLGYSYSVFDNYEQIKRQCKSVHLLNTKDGKINPYKTASHVALLGIKHS